MDEAVRAYEVLKKTRTIKKGLLTRCVNRLRAVVGQGADVQADTVDESRRRARLLLQELDNINVQMETVLLEMTSQEKTTKKASHVQRLASSMLKVTLKK